MVQHNLGCMQAVPGSPGERMERLAVGRWEDVEDTLAVRGCTQPGCKAWAGWEGRLDRLEIEGKKHKNELARNIL